MIIESNDKKMIEYFKYAKAYKSNNSLLIVDCRMSEKWTRKALKNYINHVK